MVKVISSENYILVKIKLDFKKPHSFFKITGESNSSIEEITCFSAALTCISNDVFGPWVLGVAPADQFLHFINVKRSYNLGKG